MTQPSSLSLYSVVLVFLGLIYSSFGYPTPIPYSVMVNIGSREFRYHHFLFHNIRNTWESLDNVTQAQIASYGWQPPRPSKNANGSTISDNGSGEDFLYMHRKMINMVNTLHMQGGYPNVTSWTDLPAGNDTDWPMPPVYVHPTDNTTTNLMAYYKTDEWYVYLTKQAAHIKDPKFLSNITLGELGAYIEFTSDIHQGMHYRFSRYNPWMHIRTNVAVPFFDYGYDTMSSNWLPDLYSSHMNPWFFKLHGWINDRIDDWAAANNITEIQWNGTWTGGSMDTLPKSLNYTPNYPTRYLRQGRSLMDMDDMQDVQGTTDDCMDTGMGKMNITAMEAVIKILYEKGVACHTYAELNGNVAPPPLESLKDFKF